MSYRILCAKMIGTFTAESLELLQQNASLSFSFRYHRASAAKNGFMYPARYET